MKRFICVLAALTLLGLPVLAGAAGLEECTISNGTVCAVKYVDIMAPCSGTLLPFEVKMGDEVKVGDELFAMLTSTVYATESGTVGAVFIAPGDDAAAVTQHYGSVMTFEPEWLLTVDAQINGASTDSKNKTIHNGETVYVAGESNSSHEGKGRVISVDGGNYVVELQEYNDLKSGNTVNIYRSEEHTSKSNIGKGTVRRRSDVLVQGAGRVTDVYVKQDDEIKAGDKLFSVLGADAEPGVSDKIKASADGVIATVAVQPGQQVWKGQMLCRIYLTSEIEVVASVDEMDLRGLRVGDSVQVTLDVDEKRVLSGTVTEISGLGITRANAAYYDVHVSIAAGSGMLGCSASLYLPK